MGGYILKRLISAVPVLLGITIIVFLIMSLIPGDPATAILGSYATPENVEKLNRDLGLDKPLVQRYFIWLGNMLTGDFGRSFSLNRPVLDEVAERFNATMILAGGTGYVVNPAVLGFLGPQVRVELAREREERTVKARQPCESRQRFTLYARHHGGEGAYRSPVERIGKRRVISRQLFLRELRVA